MLTQLSTRTGELSVLRGRRLWIVAFLAFFLLGAAWATATPYDGLPDEMSHILRAAGAGRGEVIPEKATAAEGNGAFQTVGKGLIKGSACWRDQRWKNAGCAAEPGGDNTLVRVHTVAGRYPPAYYVAVGWPLAVWPNWGGVLGARLIGAALVAALLASAAYGAVRWTSHRLLPASVMVAVTPITLHLAGGVNPSGVEIAAGVALFVSLAVLMFDGKVPAPPAALTLAGVSALALVLVRPFGPLWLLVVAAAMALPLRRSRLRAGLATRARRVWLGVVAAGAVLAALWTLLMGTGQPGALIGPVDLSLSEALRIELFLRLPGYASEMVGVMSWLDTPLPGLSYLIWHMCLGMLLLTAAAAGDWVDRSRMLILAGVTFGLPVIADSLNVRTYGFVAQGRYTLPIAVGLPVLAACILGRRGVLHTEAVALTRLLAVLLIPVQMLALWFAMIRWQGGVPYGVQAAMLVPLKGGWLPPLGPLVPLTVAVLGGALYLAYAWFAVARPKELIIVNMDPEPRVAVKSGSTPAAGS